jgi:60 kDa SS-A/Ro ribonucleoprotein
MSYSVTGQQDQYGATAKKDGHKMGKTSKVRCIDVAALVSACVLRSNPTARVIPFEGHVVQLALNPRDSVMTNAQKLSSIGGGSTNCSAPLAKLNQEKTVPDVVIFISDYESWVDSPRAYGGTAMLAEWQKIVKRNPKAKLICIDVTPYETHQMPDRPGILRVGGFSDTVFNVISAFISGGAQDWISQIEAIQ